MADITPTNYSVSYIVKIPKLIQRIKASLFMAIYGNKTSDCLLSRSQRLIGLEVFTIVVKLEFYCKNVCTELRYF